MSQTNVREGYKITTLEVVELIEDLISYYSAKVKTEDLSNTLMLTLSKTAQRQSSSVVFNRSTALITNKFSVALLTKPAILNNANVALVDAVHYSIVIDALTMTLIKNDDDLLGTVNSHIKLRRLRAVMLLCQTTKPLGDSNKDGPPLKRCKTEAADSRYAKVSRGRTKKDKDSEDSDTSSDNEGQSLCKSRDGNRTLHSRRLTDAYILYFKELSSNNSGIFANAIGIGKTQAIVLAILIEHLCSTEGERTFYCACERSPSFNAKPQQAATIITSRLTKEEVIEMRINTTNAISKALAAANKLVALRSYVLEGVDHREIFVIVCSFRKVDKHVFRAYNTISVTAQRTIIRKGGPYVEKRAILLPSYVTRNIIANVKHDASEHESSYNIKGDFLPYFQSCPCLDFLSTVQNAKQQCRDILEKEGLNKLEASRRFKTYSSCKVKRFTSNSVKDLFTNLSKDYFLVREARAITKSSLNIAAEDAAKAANTPLLLKEVRAKILIGSYKLIVQAVTWLGLREKFSNKSVLVMQRAEMCVGIIYFNLDSKLELKVLGKQDVKTTS
ncbi:hypothetical protein HBI71_149310 [Parastagonospora nodorum]|nr:hypothetical protein HBI71_149310 [Parastagonospora nodorum]